MIKLLMKFWKFSPQKNTPVRYFLITFEKVSESFSVQRCECTECSYRKSRKIFLHLTIYNSAAFQCVHSVIISCGSREPSQATLKSPSEKWASGRPKEDPCLSWRLDSSTPRKKNVLHPLPSAQHLNSSPELCGRRQRQGARAGTREAAKGTRSPDTVEGEAAEQHKGLPFEMMP